MVREVFSEEIMFELGDIRSGWVFRLRENNCKSKEE